jgi:hypothetical protein
MLSNTGLFNRLRANLHNLLFLPVYQQVMHRAEAGGRLYDISHFRFLVPAALFTPNLNTTFPPK